MRLALVGCLALLAVVLPAQAQEGLRIHAVESGEGVNAVLGGELLALPLDTIQTVGLEEDADGTFAVTAWLTPAAAADLAQVTEAATGSVVAVVHRGRVLHTPRVDSAVPNGLVTMTGFSEADADRLAADLRGAPRRDADAHLDSLLGEEAPPASEGLPSEDPPGGSEPVWPPGTGGQSASRPAMPVSGPPLPTSESADAVALDFVTALDRRDWARAADRLHPDAQVVLRADALATLRLDGPTVRVREGLTEGAFPMASVLPYAGGPLDDLSARDLAALYLAGLDAVGAWGPPGTPRTVVGQAADGAVVHVVLRAAGAIQAGASAVTVVSVRPDPSGSWRVLLTDARGF